jgi:hypothetical protein
MKQIVTVVQSRDHTAHASDVVCRQCLSYHLRMSMRNRCFTHSAVDLPCDYWDALNAPALPSVSKYLSQAMMMIRSLIFILPRLSSCVIFASCSTVPLLRCQHTIRKRLNSVVGSLTAPTVDHSSMYQYRSMLLVVL